jgi:uncharacterized membrane protein YfcA
VTLAFLCAVVAGGLASVAGFGIGSLLTPIFALSIGTKLAVAAVSIPHLIGSAQRFWRLRHAIDHRVLWSFGITSAVGGLIGALLHNQAGNRALSIVFGALLILAGASQLTGFMERIRWGRTAAWIAGGVSGLFGGMVGNQGGIRTAAMLGFDVPRDSFVATATAIALFVDAARMPVYAAVSGRELLGEWRLILAGTVGVVIGTAIGTRLLSRIPQQVFRRVIGVLLVALGIYMATRY